MPARNLAFTGRKELLGAVRAELVSGDRAVVQALRGMGGVGKTQLVIEYAYRHAPDYDIVWWITAEQPELISGQFAALGAALGCTQPETDDAAVRRAVLGELRERERWLLVFDNAEAPETVGEWLPGGSGHVLITSRAAGWDEVAASVEVGVLERGESVALLRRRVPSLDETDADLIAAATGDLPLAVAQAAGYMAPAGISAADYVGLVEARAAEILDAGRPASYPLSLAAVTQLGLDRLEVDSPAAAQAVRICAFLAPEPVPTAWFTRAAAHLPQPLSSVAADQLAWGHALARISGQALARIDQQGLLMHRLTQAIIRTFLSPTEAASVQAQAASLLAASRPGDYKLPSTWPEWARLLPHLLALDPDASNEVLSRLTASAVWYQIRCGAASSAHDLARRQYQHRLGLDGPDAPETLAAAAALAAVLQTMGRHADARVMFEDSFTRRRRALGEEHRDTLTAAGNLASCLREVGEYQAARDLDEDTLARRRRVLGEDHPHTLTNASNLAGDLHALGEDEAARELYEDTLARRRQVLGEDHPDTLTSAANLASTLRALGEYQAARELHEDTLGRRRRVLGEHHPHTLTNASNLAITLRVLGEYQAARELDEDTLAKRRRILGEKHPDTLKSVRDLASDLRSLGEYQAAQDLTGDTREVQAPPGHFVAAARPSETGIANPPPKTVALPDERGFGWLWSIIRRLWPWRSVEQTTRNQATGAERISEPIHPPRPRT